jgi:hypothetical protein
MAESKISCLRCQGDMVAGFMPNPLRGEQIWYEGVAPKTYRENFMFGRKPSIVTTFRCSACGYLESYARA